MSNEPFGTELIERYLLARGRRYFRGHHDGEYFFILTVGHERLHVHIELSSADCDTFTVRVVPAYFFPAADRARLMSFADKWNRDSRATRAIVHESCDKSRIGVTAENSYPLATTMPFDEFAGLADNTIRSAVKLFAEITPVGDPTPGRTLGAWFRDAG